MKSNAEEKAKQIYDFMLTQIRRIDHLESFIFRCGEEPKTGLSFEEALSAMKRGASIINKKFHSDPIRLIDENVSGDSGMYLMISFKSTLDDNWEIVEEKTSDNKIKDWSL